MDQLKSPFELALRNRAAQITEYRFQLQNERSERRKLMAIEIKGLKADALTARANLDKLRAAYARFNEAAPAHAADVEGLATTIGGMQSDLEFAATVMGNSSGESERLSDGQKPPVVTPNILAGVGDLNQPKAAPESIVGDTATMLQTFPPDTTDRVALGPHPDQPTALPEVSLEASNHFRTLESEIKFNPASTEPAA